jgi:membrane peptidoglycan carboxypeptidase
VARATLDATRCPVGDSAQLGNCAGSTAADTRRVVRHPVFGKTGTTDRDKTAALIAGTTSLVVAGYLVNPDYQNHPDHVRHEQVNPAVYRTLADYMKGKPKVQFKEPANHKLAYGEQRSIPDVTCDSMGDAQSRIEAAGFFVSVAGSPVDSTCPAGTATGTDPTGRTVKNGVVVIQESNGKGASPPDPADGVIPIPPGITLPKPGR